VIFSKSIVGNSRAAKEQFAEVNLSRQMANNQERIHTQVARASGFVVNEGLIPQDVYQEFDTVSVERMRSDDGDTFLNDLLPLSRSVSIGKLVHKFRRSSDAGNAQSSMTGQIGVKMDQVDFSYDGSIVPIHDTGFTRNWREWNAQGSEGFDALIDDQRESVATLRRKLADNFLNGHTDAQGTIIAVDGLSWSGMRNDTRVAQVNLGAAGVNFDFTDKTKTYTEIETAFKEVRDVLYITNNCEKEATYYISRTMGSNFERNSSESYSSGKILDRLAQLMGVASIKTSSKLVGNELMAFPLDANNVRPIVGMGLNTISMPRPLYNSNYDFVVMGAIGFEVRTDFTGQTCAMFAQ
jgi:hypothetical protein